MDSVPSTGQERLITRSSQACQRCRALKARCLPSTEDGTCQRCFKAGRSCIWAEFQPKPKKRRGPSRIYQVEEKIDRLVAQVANGSTTRHDGSSDSLPSASKTHSGFTQSTNDSLSSPANLRQRPEPRGKDDSDDGQGEDEDDDDGDDDTRSRSSLHEVAKMHNFDLAASDGQAATRSRRSKADENLGRILSANSEADRMLDEFRLMAPSFPFVCITQDMTVQSLCAQKPMLLLAVMTAASWRTRRMQMALEKQFRRELALRTIIQPQKNVVLLQSILLYLAWSHYYLDHRLQNPRTVLHLAIAMLSDLKLIPTSGIQFGRERPPKLTGREEQRAVLGCYFLCSTFSNEYPDMQSMKYTEYIEACSQRFRNEPEFEHDEIIPLLISSRRVDDMIKGSIPSTDRTDLSISEDSLMSQFLQFKSQVETFMEHSQNEGHQRILKLLTPAVESRFYNRLSASVPNLATTKPAPRSPAPFPSPSTNPASPSSYPTQLSVFNSRLEAGKAYLDVLVSLPSESSHLLSLPEWTYLARIIMDLASLSTPNVSQPAGWDIARAQDHIRLPLYLDALCYRMQALTTCQPPSQPVPDWWAVMRLIMGSVCTWYRRKVAAAAKRSRARSGTSHAAAAGDGCPAMAPVADHSAANAANATGWESMAGATAFGALTPELLSASSAMETLGSVDGRASTAGWETGFAPVGGAEFGDWFCPMMPSALRMMDFTMDAEGLEGFDISQFDFAAWGEDNGLPSGGTGGRGSAV